MKMHLKLGKKVDGEWKVSKSRAECGRRWLGNPTNVGVHLNTKAFRERYKQSGADDLCLACVERAKQQGRI